MPGLGACHRHGIIIQMRPLQSRQHRLWPPPPPLPCWGITVPTMIRRQQCGRRYPQHCRSRMHSSTNGEGGQQAWQGAEMAMATMMTNLLLRWPWRNTLIYGMRICTAAVGTNRRHCWDWVWDSTPPCSGIYWQRGTGCIKAVGAVATAYKMVIKHLPWHWMPHCKDCCATQQSIWMKGGKVVVWLPTLWHQLRNGWSGSNYATINIK
jgi:hypothetical protein